MVRIVPERPDNSLPVNKLPAVARLGEDINRRWPEAAFHDPQADRLIFKSGLAAFDQLFPMGGLPYGQLLEITGPGGSGKTGFLFHLLAGIVTHQAGIRIAYLDFPNTFFPVAAECGGISPANLYIVKPDSVAGGIRAAELLLKHREVSILVCDLVGITTELPLPILHRIRQKTVRARGMVLFLTERPAGSQPIREIVPASMASLRLEISRVDDRTVRAVITKSRICPPGKEIEVTR